MTEFDTTPTPSPTYDSSKVPAEIRKIANYVRTKYKGEDILEAIAQSSEIAGLIANEALEVQAYDGNSLADVTLAKDGLPTLDARIRRDVNNLENKKADKSEVTAQLAQKVDKGNVSVSDINKNLGKLDQSFMSDEFLQQMAGNTPINAVPADGSITTVKLAQNAVERANIKDSAIGNSKIASRAVTGDKIGIEEITSENIALQGIERKNIKDKAIGNAQIVDNAVSGNKILDGAIASDKIADNAITDSKIPDNSITYNKTGFLKLVEPINLFDGYFTNFNLAGSSVFTFVKDPSTEHYGAILKINPGKTYSVATNPDYSGTVKIGTSTQLVDGGQLNGSLALNRTVSDGFERVFTAGDNDQYLYVDLYVEGFLKVVESVNPVIPFIGEKYPIFPSDKEVGQVVWFGDSISCLRNLPHRVENAIGDKVFDVSIAGSTGSTHSGGLAYDGTSFVGLVDAVVNNDWTRVDESAALRDHWKNDENIATLKTVDFNTIDKVVLFYGTNDFGGSQNSLETYRSGMVSSIETLLNAYPHLQFYFITPMYRNDWDTVNSQGLTLKEYVNETLEIAKRYSFPVLNAFESVGINDLNSGYYLNADGLHQNDSGDELLGEKLSKFLLSN